MKIFSKNKILVLFILIVINISSLSANSGELDLSIEVDVPLETYLPIVYYKGNQLGYKDKVMDANNKPFDITIDGETESFTIRIEGNEGSGKLLKVKIDGAYFVSTEEGSTSNQSSVFAYPVFMDNNVLNDLNESFISYFVNIPLGPHDEKKSVLENQFKLVWKGNSQLPFGIYTCGIDVNYTVI